MNDKELDKLFKDQLSDAEVSPSDQIWGEIEKELDRPHKKTIVRKLNWMKYAALLLVTLGVAILLHSRFSEEEIQPTKLAQLSEEQLEVKLPPVSVEKAQIESPKTEAIVHQVASNRQVAAKQATAIEEPTVEKLTQPFKQEKKLALPNLSLATVKLPKSESLTTEKVIRRRVVEVEPIRPLVDLEEGEETMLANNNSAPNQNIVTGILNKLSNAINTDEQKIVRFSHDEEGSFHIDINSFAKNRFKRKK